MTNNLDHKLLQSLGLDIQKVVHHQKKIHHVLSKDNGHHIPIIDVCSVDNGNIVNQNTLIKILENIKKYLIFNHISQEYIQKWLYSHIGVCIPAAGASSRYWVDIDSEKIGEKKLFPKAFLQATTEKDTFLEIKVIEYAKTFNTKAHIFIAPEGFKNNFIEHIQNAEKKFDFSETKQTHWLVLEQNNFLATIRFNLDGQPYLNQQNTYSKVPAGHGELLNLFDDIVKAFPDLRAVHLRNIDNIIGTMPNRQQELNRLAQSYYYIQLALDTVRKTVNKFSKSPEHLKRHLQTDATYLSAIDFLNQISPDFVPKFNSFSEKEIEDACNQIQKPLSVFGIVKKEANDQGGGPVIAKLKNNKNIKICLEMSHASPHDQEKYFGKNGLLEYFNPVLVFFEIKNEEGAVTDFKNLFNEDFWILSKREFDKQHMYHHESVLYELIGNSEKTNLVFIEVPRTLFKPHKYYRDSENMGRAEYGIVVSR